MVIIHQTALAALAHLILTQWTKLLPFHDWAMLRFHPKISPTDWAPKQEDLHCFGKNNAIFATFFKPHLYYLSNTNRTYQCTLIAFLWETWYRLFHAALGNTCASKTNYTTEIKHMLRETSLRRIYKFFFTDQGDNSSESILRSAHPVLH